MQFNKSNDGIYTTLEVTSGNAPKTAAEATMMQMLDDQGMGSEPDRTRTDSMGQIHYSYEDVHNAYAHEAADDLVVTHPLRETSAIVAEFGALDVTTTYTYAEVTQDFFIPLLGATPKQDNKGEYGYAAVDGRFVYERTMRRPTVRMSVTLTDGRMVGVEIDLLTGRVSSQPMNV